MIQPEVNWHFTPEQIADFIIDNDKCDIFKSARLNKEQFIEAIRTLNYLKYIIIFQKDKELHGVLGWYFVSDENKHKATKATWRLPDNIIDGDILYLSFIATKGNCNILGIKKMFEDWGYRNRITRRRGYTKGAWYENNIFRD